MAGGKSLIFRVLGPIDAVVDGVPIDVGGPRQRRLVAVLCAGAGNPVPTGVIVERIFGDGDLPADPRATLRTYVARLRRVCGDRSAVVTDPDGYRLDTNRVRVDAEVAERLIDEGSAIGVDASVRIEALTEALSLWRGDPYDAGRAGDWLRGELRRLEELRMVAIERRFEAMLEAGLHGDAIPELQAAVEEEPLRERLVGQLMLALHRGGRRSAAIRVYQNHRRNMDAELGLDPDPSLVELDRRILAGDPSLDLGPDTGRSIGGYRIGPQIGQGAWSTVHRGVQPSVGREVAIKIIRAELANRPEFIRRFAAEAQTLAHLEHPHIVPLYDFWREPDRAFLVFRYLRGPTLAGQLERVRWLSLDEWRRIAHHVGSALEAAHRAGVIHHDVEAQNVLSDGDGNYFLSDFGIARNAPVDTMITTGGTDQASNGADSGAGGRSVDIRSFASLLAEALPRVAGDQDDRMQRLSTYLESIIGGREPASVHAMVGQLESIVHGVEPDAQVVGARTLAVFHNPYKGLRSFTESDAEDFFGRDRLIESIVDQLGDSDGVVTVLGPSGVGKSSVIRAGVIPALRRSAIPGSHHWYVATMTPGTDPFEELATALLRVAERVPANMTSLLREPGGVARVVRSLLPEDRSTELLLVVDQFEELFTLLDDEEDRGSFLRGIEAACRDQRCRIRILLSIRADFWDRPLRYGSFARLVEQSVVHVAALEPDELELAIVGPAHRIGCEFEPGLVARLVTDVHSQPGALPHLQFALTELVERNRSQLLTAEDYDRIGGVAGAVAAAAEGLYQQATRDSQATIRMLFGRLVILNPGGPATRDRVTVASLEQLGDIQPILDHYGHARLLSFDRTDDTREPTVEIAHEALVDAWPRLVQWLDEDAQHLINRRQLSDASAAWAQRGRDPSELYRGGRLETAEALLNAPHVALTEGERAFVNESRRRRDAAANAERAHVRRLRRLVTAAATVAVVALAAGALAVVQWNRANDEAFDAETARLVATARELAATNPRESMLVALAAHQRTQTPETLGALHASLGRAGPLLGHLGRGIDYIDVAWLGNEFVVAIRDDGVDVYDRSNAQLVDSVDLDVGRGPFPRFSEGERAAGGDRLVAVASGSRVHVFTIDGTLTEAFVVTMGDDVAAVDVAGDDSVIATDMAGTVAGWTAGGQQLFATSVPLPENVTTVYDEYVDLPFQGRELFEAAPVWITPTVVGDEIHLSFAGLHAAIDFAGRSTMERVFPIVPLGEAATPAVGTIVAQGDVGLVHAGVYSIGLIDRDTSGVVTIPLAEGTFGGGNPAMVDTISVLGEPVTLLENGLAVWFDLNDGSRARSLDLGLDEIRAASPGPAPGTVALATLNGIALVSLGGGGPISTVLPRDGDQSLLSITSNGKYVSMGGSGWLAPVDLLERQPDGTYQSVPNTSFEGSIFAAAPPEYGDPWTVLFEDQNGRWRTFVYRLDGPDGPQLVADWLDAGGGVAGDMDPGWRHYAWGTRTSIDLTAMPSGDLLRSFELPPGALEVGGPSGVRFDPAGERLLISSPTGASHLYDTTTWTRRDGVDQLDIALGYWSIDGTLIATASSDGQITVRDGETFRPVREMVGAVGTSNSWAEGALLFSPDNALLITNHDNVGRLWSVATGQQIGIDLPTWEQTTSGVNTGDTLQLVTGTEQSALVWNLDTDSWPGIACRTAGTNLTRAEWTQWGPRDEEYRAICDQYPIEP